jgi:hypothetical protein
LAFGSQGNLGVRFESPPGAKVPIAEVVRVFEASSLMQKMPRLAYKLTGDVRCHKNKKQETYP